MFSKKVKAKNIEGEEFEVDLKGFKNRVGVYGILIVDGKILLQRHPRAKKFGLPGGAVEVDEKINEALVREFKEETGLDIEVGELVDIGQFYYYDPKRDKKTRSFTIIHRVLLLGGDLLIEGNNFDTAEVKYFDLQDLKQEDIHWFHEAPRAYARGFFSASQLKLCLVKHSSSSSHSRFSA